MDLTTVKAVQATFPVLCLSGTLLILLFSEPEAAPRKEMDVVDTGTSSTDTSATTALSNQVLAALKEKPAPELCLDSQDLEVGENDTTIFWQISPSERVYRGSCPCFWRL